MERVSVLCLLLLLLCSLSGAELQGNDIIEQDKPESLNVLQQPQPSPSDLHAVVRDMSAKLAALQTEMKQMRTCNQAGQVAFSASLVATEALTMGPFNTHTPVIFRHVVTNIGNAYNPNTGFFIAPVRGAYHFEFYILGPMDGSHASWAFLVKNGGHVFAAYERQGNGWGSSSNGVTLLLEEGDVVFVRLWQHTKIYDDHDHFSTFSGHLLFPL